MHGNNPSTITTVDENNFNALGPSELNTVLVFKE